jgi:hypothetical protein
MAPLSSAGFIDHHITGVVYPAGMTGFVQAAVLVAVLLSWTGYALTGGRGVRHRRTVVGTV